MFLRRPATFGQGKHRTAGGFRRLLSRFELGLACPIVAFDFSKPYVSAAMIKNELF